MASTGDRDGRLPGGRIGGRPDRHALGYDRRRREPSDREIHVLESIAVQIATLLERVVLLRESAAQHRLQRDLQLASQCQSFDVVTSLAPDSGIEAAVRSTSRFEIGGDLSELISVDEGRTVLSIGDASGHGISASIVMSAVRGGIRAWVSIRGPRCPPMESSSGSTAPAHSITPAHQFMSLFYGVIDTRQKLLTYSNAGHPSPVLMRDGGAIMLESHGMLLGVVADATYGASAMPIELRRHVDRVYRRRERGDEREAENVPQRRNHRGSSGESRRLSTGDPGSDLVAARKPSRRSQRARRPLPDGDPRPIRESRLEDPPNAWSCAVGRFEMRMS